MKKNYIQPESQIIELNYFSPILAGSGEDQVVSPNDADPNAEDFQLF